MSILITVAVFIFIGMFGSIDWLTHRDMVKSSTKQYGISNYKQFVEEFHKIEWDYERGMFPDSLFTKDYSSQFHANIVQFNGIGMIINNPFSYLRVKLYVKKQIESNRRVNSWS